MRVLGVIPARGGSVGVPRKNIRLLNGVPLIGYAIQAANQSQLLTRTIVSTDDDEIAEVARTLGADIPFMRPAELAKGTTPTVAVIQHILETLPEQYDAVATLQPTAPLRTAKDIDAAIALLTDDFDSVVSVCKVPEHYNPNWIHNVDGGTLNNYIPDGPIKYTRRQDLPPVYYRNGAVYVTRTAAVFTYGNLYGKKTAASIMPPERSVNIDSLADLWVADYYLSQNR